jgi:hypothetical protein
LEGLNKMEERTIPTFDGKTTTNNLGSSFQPMKYLEILFSNIHIITIGTHYM